jgi:hypothetical protein
VELWLSSKKSRNNEFNFVDVFRISEMTGIGLNTVLRISTVLVSLAVVSTPIIYPKYSLYVRRAKVGLNKLNEVRVEQDDVRHSYIEQGQKGFDELSEAIELIFGSVGDMERICFTVGEPPELGDFTGLGMENGFSDNGVLYADTKNGDRELLRWEPWSPRTTLEMEKLQRGIVLRARERSHFVTIALAVLWATLSIVIVV